MIEGLIKGKYYSLDTIYELCHSASAYINNSYGPDSDEEAKKMSLDDAIKNLEATFLYLEQHGDIYMKSMDSLILYVDLAIATAILAKKVRERNLTITGNIAEEVLSHFNSTDCSICCRRK